MNCDQSADHLRFICLYSQKAYFEQLYASIYRQKLPLSYMFVRLIAEA